MRNVILIRTQFTEVETLGILLIPKNVGNDVMILRTLELPYKENRNNISCIPTGIYKCIYDKMSNGTTAYRLLDVPNRSGIFIHSANYYKQIKGCIVLGYGYKDINADSELDIVFSRKAIDNFEEEMSKEDFMLHIINKDYDK